MKRKFDLFVFHIILFSTVLDLGIMSIGNFIADPMVVSVSKLFMGIGYIVVLIRFIRDPDYKFLYYLGCIIVMAVVNGGIIFIMNRYIPTTNIYGKKLIEGVIDALIYSYFYQYFKESSYRGVREFMERNNLT